MNSNWWLSSLPPISGGLRAVFYLGLLLLCFIDFPSPLHSAKIIAEMNPVFYTPAAVLRWMGVRWVKPGTLRVVTLFTVVAWLGAAFGLWMPVTAVLTFLGFAFLHAVNWGALGSNHSTHSALYVLFCLCFSVSPGWPFEGLASSHLRWFMIIDKGSLFESGFAPRLIMICLIYFMFAAGVAKIRYGGLSWLNGDALRFYIAQSSEYARWSAFARLLAGSPTLCRLLSWFTIAVELGSIALLLESSWTWPIVILWCWFHIGILLVMMPAYWVQMWCYILLLDWNRLLGGTSSMYALRHTLSEAVLTASGIAFILALLWVLLTQLESWPLTEVAMYSNNVDAGEPLRLDQLQLRARTALRQDANAWKRPWVTAEAWEDILVFQDGGSSPLTLFELLQQQPGIKPVRWSQYAKVLRRVAIHDLAAKPEGALEYDEGRTGFPATCFLRKIANLIRDALPEKGIRMDFMCHTHAGWVVLGRTVF